MGNQADRKADWGENNACKGCVNPYNCAKIAGVAQW